MQIFKHSLQKENADEKANNSSGVFDGNIKYFLNGTLKAKRYVIPSDQIENHIKIHPLNPRNQDALTLESVKDILASIEKRGILTEGIALRSIDSDDFLLLDASRRRFCCIELGVDLPLWVFEDILPLEKIFEIINDSQEIKRWSYAEHGNYILKVAKINGLDVSNMTIKAIAEHFNLPSPWLRKRLEASRVDIDLRKLFPNYEDIPNTYYARLSKISKKIDKCGLLLNDFIDDIKNNKLINITGEISKQHEKIMKILEDKVNSICHVKPPKWQKKDLVLFDDINKYARVSRSSDGKIFKLELSRVGAKKLMLIEKYALAILEEKEINSDLEF